MALPIICYIIRYTIIYKFFYFTHLILLNLPYSQVILILLEASLGFILRRLLGLGLGLSLDLGIKLNLILEVKLILQINLGKLNFNDLNFNDLNFNNFNFNNFNFNNLNLNKLI